jgi:hypothetical protein
VSRWSSSLRRTAASSTGSATAAPAIAGPRVKRSPMIGSLGCQTCSSATIAPVMIGMAIAPNATGAVLATSATAAALSGWKPSAISITAVIATGVPNPASASSRAAKQNAMITAWIRWSFEIRPNDLLSTAKWPVASVMLYIQIAFQTIHMIGNRPKTAPSSAESSACPSGIV